MKKTYALAAITLCLLPLAAFAAPANTAGKAPVKKTAVATMYECTKCHMKVDAATAKKDGYKDPMDGGKLVPVKPSSSAAKPMSGMSM